MNLGILIMIAFPSIWSLHQDNRERERFVFCKVQVVLNPTLKGKAKGSLASHGNIPAATSVAKHLNSNKVFCMQGYEAEGNQPSGSGYVVVPTLTSSTSSDSSSIEIIGSSNDMGFFLPGNEDRTISSPPDLESSTGFIQHSLEGYRRPSMNLELEGVEASFVQGNLESSFSHSDTTPEVKIMNNVPTPHIPAQIPVSPSPWEIPSENKTPGTTHQTPGTTHQTPGTTHQTPGSLNIHTMCDNVQQMNIGDQSEPYTSARLTTSSQSESPADMFRSELLAALGSANQSPSGSNTRSPTRHQSAPSNKHSVPRRPKSQSGESPSRFSTQSGASATGQSGASATGQSGASATASITSASQSGLSVSDPDMRQKLRLLRDMGFEDDGTNEQLLLERSVEDVALYLSARTDDS